MKHVFGKSDCTYHVFLRLRMNRMWYRIRSLEHINKRRNEVLFAVKVTELLLWDNVFVFAGEVIHGTYFTNSISISPHTVRIHFLLPSLLICSVHTDGYPGLGFLLCCLLQAVAWGYHRKIGYTPSPYSLLHPSWLSRSPGTQRMQLAVPTAGMLFSQMSPCLSPSFRSLFKHWLLSDAVLTRL